MHTLRRLAPPDAPLFARIAPQVFDEPVRPDRLAAYLAAPGHHMIVALGDDGQGTPQIVGMCMAAVHLHPDKVDELYIDEVGVAQGWRRRGIARAMIADMLDWGRELGCGEVWVGTEPDNSAANALYARFDFTTYAATIYEGDL